jgi:hypothetical protein
MRRIALSITVIAMVGIAPATANATVPRFGHVFLIVGENTSYEQLTAKHAPFLTSVVKPDRAWLSNCENGHDPCGTRYDHYSLERTLAQGFGLAPLAHARKARPIAGIWR